ncbi:hypothetical protein [Microvirga sp. G4-2]|uniref:hypothetical protein n=1 Tax=Microvirga sp. G4-2 TaxID=3434467 RepID=UPI004044F6CA
MAYTNLSIKDDTHSRKAWTLLEAEKKFWEDEALRLQMKLDNIPRAIREHGYITVHDGGDALILVPKDEGKDEA